MNIVMGSPYDRKSNRGKRRDRKGLKKEKVVMLAAALFVLSALTMTGVYVKEKNKENQDDYVVDLSSMEKKIPEKAEEIVKEEESANQVSGQVKGQTNRQANGMEVDDLDADPVYQETNSGQIELSKVPKDTLEGEIKNNWDTAEETERKEEGNKEENEEEKKEQAEGEKREGTKPEKKEEDTVKTGGSAFPAAASLQWPIVGNVLMNYSMDKTVYFASLEQYKYNPAIIIEAQVGEPVTAAAAGEVVKIMEDEEIGNAVVTKIGSDYEVTYGQLEKIQVATGENIEKGALLGYVAAPTKYYSVEGSNVYFKLTKNGKPIDPLSTLDS